MKRLIRLLAIASVTAAFSCAAQQLDFYVQLVRGSDLPEPLHAAVKEIGPILGQKLRPVFKWKYYFVNQQEKITLRREKPSKLALNNGSELEVCWTSDDKIQICLRKGKKQTSKTKHQNHPELMIIEGIESQNHEPWFVVLRRNKPLAPDPATAAK